MSTYWSGRSVFVTGATGFVGAWLSRELIGCGARVVCLVRDEVPHSMFFQSGLRDQVISVSGSLGDLPLLERTLEAYEVDTCFHLAAEAIVSVAQGSPLSAFESNIRGTWHLLEAARRSGAVKHIVVASTDSVYGQQSQLPCTEESALLGSSPYDVSKVCADVLARSYFRSYGLPVVVARCTNIYGGGDLNFSRLIPGTILSVLRGARPIIRGGGRHMRDLLYIEDAVRAYMALGEKLSDERVRGEAFNFGTGCPVQVLALVNKIMTLAGREDLLPVVLNQSRNEIQDRFLSSEKAWAVLGWRAQWTLEEGLAKTLAWYEKFGVENGVTLGRNR